MSDVNPRPAAGQPNQQKQLIMVAVLGVVFLLVLVFMVLKPFGGDDASAPQAPAVTDGTGVPSGAPAVAPATPETTTPGPPPARGRNPFDPPR